jgi:hypothetical protein
MLRRTALAVVVNVVTACRLCRFTYLLCMKFHTSDVPTNRVDQAFVVGTSSETWHFVTGTKTVATRRSRDRDMLAHWVVHP